MEMRKGAENSGNMKLPPEKRCSSFACHFGDSNPANHILCLYFSSYQHGVQHVVAVAAPNLGDG